MNPYITQFQGLDQQGLAPVFQNIAQQQATQNAALNQQNQLTQQASQTGQSGGMNPLAMAMALRGKKPPTPGLGQMTDAQGNVVPDPTYGSGNAYGNMTSGEISNMMANGI